MITKSIANHPILQNEVMNMFNHDFLGVEKNYSRHKSS
jgi:hypothetical protein